ncbi:MAG: flagellar brake protein [Phycisphaerae bacterium]|nr:flagellar brake protein [Phycisphaerae bacterium]
MPASRSRATHWRRTLQQIQERDGALELALAPDAPTDGPRTGDLVWRAKLLAVGTQDLIVEAPRTLGHEVRFPPGTELVVAAVVGQNRWMFRTTVRVERRGVGGGLPGTLIFSLPDSIERCSRRHGRYDARGLELPEVQCWPLLDPSSVVPATRACADLWARFRAREPIDASTLDSLLPTVGPRFGATLMNIGGGGLGVRVAPADAPVLFRHPILWLRIELGEATPVPMLTTAKVVHTHIDSEQMTYAGLAFDFSFHPRGLSVAAEQILHAIEWRQRQRPLRAA